MNLIVATNMRGVMGADGKLPWHVPADLAFFKEMTMGGTLIVGRKTADSIGRALPGREMIVLSRQVCIPGTYPGAHTATSKEEAIEIAATLGKPVWVAGGAQIYKLFAPYVQRIYHTSIAVDVFGDTLFPDEIFEGFEARECRMDRCEKSGIRLTYTEYIRANKEY